MDLIQKAAVEYDSIRVSLKSGVTVEFSIHEDYIHIHFSGTEGRIHATAIHSATNLPKLELANYIDIGYKARKQ